MKIDHNSQGRAQITSGNAHEGFFTVMVDIWPRLGIIQAGNGETWKPERQLNIDDSYQFSIGDYDITVIRKRISKGNDPKIISLDAARKRRREREQHANR